LLRAHASEYLFLGHADHAGLGRLGDLGTLERAATNAAHSATITKARMKKLP
jgi:hypothetical protein